MQKSSIQIDIHLDDKKLPEQINWSASETGSDKLQRAKAMCLGFWEKKKKNTFKIDLWTKEMPVDEMKIFFHQTLVAMADTFERATQDEKMASTMRDFTDYFAEKLELKG